MPGDGLGRSGQQYDPKWNVVFRFVKKVLDYSINGESTRVTGNEGNTATEINPMDSAAAEETVYDISAIQTALDDKVLSYAGRTSSGELNIPPILTGITVTYNKTGGNGESLHPASQQYFYAFGSSGSGDLNPRSTAQANASIIPDLVFTYREIWSNKIPVTHYQFFMPETFTEAEVITRLNTIIGSSVTSWPTFKPEAMNFAVKGMSVSLQQSADSNAGVRFGSGVSGNYEYGNGYSTENGLTLKSVRLPPMLHGAITISSASDTQTATVDVEASTIVMSATDGDGNAITVAAITNNPSALTATATGSVTPTSLSATSPATVPTSGLYLYDINSDPFGYGRILVRASVVNASEFA